VICSDLARARETADVLGLRQVVHDAAWREIDVGAWAGRTAAEVDAEGDAVTNWRGGPRTAPDGETWEAFSIRVVAALAPLLAEGRGRLVVCHGGCIRAACAHVTGGDAIAFGSPPNASVTLIEPGERPRLLAYGVTPDGVPAAPADGAHTLAG
jgi:glucosyl-3-phosphoglycerate phosphatase